MKRYLSLILGATFCLIPAMNSAQAVGFSNVPDDVLRDMFGYLKGVDSLNAHRVCKQWDNQLEYTPEAVGQRCAYKAFKLFKETVKQKGLGKFYYDCQELNNLHGPSKGIADNLFHA